MRVKIPQAELDRMASAMIPSRRKKILKQWRCPVCKGINSKGNYCVHQIPKPRATRHKSPRIAQLLLRESELGRRYTALGNFSKSADLQSLFTVSYGEYAISPESVDGVHVL